ncbi:SWIB/MDM2 domain-containing protein [Mycena amicta]|nr:SWIB/MDM2 domain-containing protein [Mycena amicta]
MEFDAGSLEPYIEEILSAPGTDLATISAKRVRKQLQHIDPSFFTPELLKHNREAVDAVIARVFERVQAVADYDVEEPSSRKRRPPSEGPESKVEEGDTDDSPPPPKKSKKLPVAKQQEASDAELARQLSNEINSRTRRSNGRSTKASSANSTPRKRKSKKSAELVDTDDSDSGGKPHKKRAREGGSARGGFAKPYLLSEPLAAVLGVESMSRPQVVKQLWIYIKANELQNPNNKREILCDVALKPIFNAEKIDMFRMNKVLGQHLHEMETS